MSYSASIFKYSYVCYRKLFYAGFSKAAVTSKLYLASVCLLAEALERGLNVNDIVMYLMPH